MFLTEAPIEEIAVIKKDGKLFVDAFDGTGENIVTAEDPISEAGRARKSRHTFGGIAGGKGGERSKEL